MVKNKRRPIFLSPIELDILTAIPDQAGCLKTPGPIAEPCGRVPASL